MTTTDRVFEILTLEGQYKPLQRPVLIGTQKFDFTHVLVATQKGNDLVVVIELTGASDNNSVIRSIHAFTRALDVHGSRRPVTVIFTSGQADKDLVNAVNRVCRVLPIGAPSGVDALVHVRDWLAALLPIKRPLLVEHLADWRSVLQTNLGAELTSKEVEQFLLHAAQGKDAVEKALVNDIVSRADQALEEGEAGE